MELEHEKRDSIYMTTYIFLVGKTKKKIGYMLKYFFSVPSSLIL